MTDAMRDRLAASLSNRPLTHVDMFHPDHVASAVEFFESKGYTVVERTVQPPGIMYEGWTLVRAQLMPAPPARPRTFTTLEYVDMKGGMAAAHLHYSPGQYEQLVMRSEMRRRTLEKEWGVPVCFEVKFKIENLKIYIAAYFRETRPADLTHYGEDGQLWLNGDKP